MRPDRARLASVVLIVIVLQFFVPLVALIVPDKPNRLGWQMYSGHGGGLVTVTDAQGRAVDVDCGEVLPKTRRPELDWTRHLPEHLCSHVEVDRLTVTIGDSSRTLTC